MQAAGKLDRRITIEAPTVSRGTTGGHEETWSTHATLWASVRDLSGREIFNAQAAGSGVSKVVTIRYLSTVTAAMRVRFENGSTARIAHLRELGRREMLEIYCEAVNG